MKNDITYEYRVFTNRLIDIESMEVGKCISKVIKELKPKDKVDGRFFHTSDTDEWFFCWNGELQKLNLKGNSDVNDALTEVEKLIADANAAVEDAKKTATEAKDAATKAQVAADAANAAVENIDNKADITYVDESLSEIETNINELNTTVSTIQSTANNANSVAVETQQIANQTKLDVEELSKAVESKADMYIIEDLTNIVNDKVDKSAFEVLSEKVDAIKVPSLDGYATEDFVNNKIEEIIIPEIPTKISAFENDVNYLTEQDITGKQDKIDDLETIRSGAALGATALQSIPEEYVTETELTGKGYLTEQSLVNYYTKDYIDTVIGMAIEKTNTILA